MDPANKLPQLIRRSYMLGLSLAALSYLAAIFLSILQSPFAETFYVAGFWSIFLSIPVRCVLQCIFYLRQQLWFLALVSITNVLMLLTVGLA